MPALNEIDGAADGRAMRLFTAALRELGGPTALVRRGEAGILPALLRSSYILVLKEEFALPANTIGGFLGVSPGTVASVFGAPTGAALARLQHEQSSQAEFDRHADPDSNGGPLSPRLDGESLAGAIAKFAYDIVRREEVRPAH